VSRRVSPIGFVAEAGDENEASGEMFSTMRTSTGDGVRRVECKPHFLEVVHRLAQSNANHGHFRGRHFHLLPQGKRNFNESRLTLRCLAVLDSEPAGEPIPLFTALVPMLSGCFDLMPVGGSPFIERCEWLIERATEIG
jgi:hypothetical protein